MLNYWETKFKSEGAVWSFEPSDSALIANDLFLKRGFKHILIPGFGYGRNAKIFIDNGFSVTGIEIAKSAIDIARENGLQCKIHQGSVTSMPFDNEQYDGIFCYALIHLLNKSDRKKFLASCYNQLKPGGLMIFVVATKKMSMFGSGKLLSKDRYQIGKGLQVFFYDTESIINEFASFGLVEHKDIEEPIKFMKGHDSLKLIFITCIKN